MKIARLLPVLGGRGRYQQLVKNLFGDATFRYYATDEISTGANATDSSANAAHAPASGATMGQPGAYNKRSYQFASPGYIDLYSAAFNTGFPKAEGTLIITVKHPNWADGQTRRFANLYTDGNNYVTLFTVGNNTVSAEYKAGSTSQLFGILGSAQPIYSDFNQIAITWSVSGSKICAYLNAAQQINPRIDALGTWTGNLNAAACVIGAFNKTGTQQFEGGWEQDIILLNRAATPLEILLSAKKQSLVMFDGDSRTYGTLVTTPYPMQILAARTNVAGFNLGVAGRKVSEMVTNATANIDTKIAAGRTTVTIFGGVNDVVDGGVDAATIFGRLETYYNARKAAGATCKVCTEIDAQDAARNTAGWHATVWPALNVLIHNGIPAADIIDLGADPRLQDATNAEYFNADKVHLTDAGNAVIRDLVSAAI
jgi:lysophospholipase L1-like esterase